MPLTLVRSEDNQTLWKACTDAFLDELGGASGPGSFPSFLWIRNRGQRDLLLEAAEARGSTGWLSPPFCFLGDLPSSARFGLGGRTVGLLTRRRLVSRIAQKHARANGITGGDSGSGVVRGHMLDRLIGELLPNGIEPDALAESLAHVASDDFARRRNAWVVGVYRDYRAELSALGLYDFRQTNALLAERVDAGELPHAIGGAKRLHVYGLHTPRDRVRLLRALHEQRDVDVRVYAPAEQEPESEWEALGLPVETLRARGRRHRVVQPAPNPRRELGWMAQQVKEALLSGDLEPHEIAVVARTGREDVRRAYDALRDVGVSATARIRTPLAEIPALRTILELFRGVAEGWNYRALRSVLSSPYFDLEVDLRWVDFIAANRRPATLADWERELAALAGSMSAHEAAGGAEDERHRELRDLHVRADRLASDLAVLVRLRERLDPVAGSRSEADWVAIALDLADHGWFDMRKRVCRVPEERHDIVRLDQRGLLNLEDLLREWSKLELDPSPLDPREWYTLLRRLLESHEIALSTPLQKGVQVLEAHDAALMPFRRVYILHANDGIFPATPLGGGVITDAERVRLRVAGLALDDHERELRRERALWRAVAAVPHVEASYRTTDPGGTPLLPSLMTLELLHPIEHAEELPRSFDPLGDPLSPSQAHHAATLELATAVASDPGAVVRVRALDPHVLRHAVLCAYGEQERGARGRRFADAAAPANPWNGELRHPQVLARLHEKFGEEKVWSASQLQLYGRSPFLFFLARVVYLQEMDEAEEDTTALIKGSIAHEVLQLFYQSYIGGPRPQALTGDTLERLRSMVGRVVDERIGRGEWLGTPVLWQVRRTAIQRQLEQFLAWELAGFVGDETPLLCEYELGSDDDYVEIEHLDAHNQPRRMRLRGRVDRIDRATSGGDVVWRVVDYKSGDPPQPRHFRRGVALQTPLYMKAVARKEGVAVDVGRYRSLKDLKNRERAILWGSDEFEKALRTAVSIPERVRRGVFELALAHGETWAPWDPGIEIRRGSVTLPVESRFDE
ncbi:MAG TPA: PD-(D/E)XK nuclease family protein [Longimicrobiales bacterium]|nr:PD-(D/E)XK nuclease family protein [Longimicrobiales bacterium]